jgi:uncharacterized protein (DUF924 family)
MDISRAKYILDYWFSKGVYTPDYDKWFLKSQDYDEEIREKFGDLLKEAEQGKGYGWLVNKDSYVAYIILMDQFSRHIYRGTGDSFKNDNGVMIFVELGFDLYKEQLKGYEFMFAFMPYMHTENLNYQKKGEKIFIEHKYLYRGVKRQLTSVNTTQSESVVNATLSPEPTNYDKEYEMLLSMESHVTGHRQVIQMFGRFPKRNSSLGRDNTLHEGQYMNREEVKKRPY